jgi:hypothetical protein
MVRPVLLVVWLALAAIAPAHAQEVIGGQPLAGSSANKAAGAAAPDAEAEGMFHILAIGDALGGGLGAGLQRMTELDGGYEVTLRYNEGSGIARPEVYDWGASLPKILEDRSFDAAVVLLGANDRQAIRAGDAQHAFSTPEWIAAYERHVDRILDALNPAVPKVYWVSLPPMADAKYDAAMQAVLEIQKRRVEAKGAVFVDIRKAFLDAHGRYTDVGPDDTGQVRKLRARDGVNFFKQGNNRMAQLVLAAIGQDRSAAEAQVEEPAAAAVPGDAAVPNVPLFGQADGAGMEATFRPDKAAMGAVASLAGAPGGLAALRALAPPGSTAEKLFVYGESPPAPAGRADDYSLP